MVARKSRFPDQHYLRPATIPIAIDRKRLAAIPRSLTLSRVDVIRTQRVKIPKCRKGCRSTGLWLSPEWRMGVGKESGACAGVGHLPLAWEHGSQMSGLRWTLGG